MDTLGVELVNFFGGEVDFNDSDTIECNYVRNKHFKNNNPEDGKEWQDFQEAIFNVEPITLSKVVKYKQFASYSNNSDIYIKEATLPKSNTAAMGRIRKIML